MKNLLFLLVMFSNICLAESVFECVVKADYYLNHDGALEASSLSKYVVGKKFTIYRKSGHILGCCGMSTFLNEPVEVKVITYGDSYMNFKSVAIWEEQIQQVIVKTITGFDGKPIPEEKPFTAFTSGRILTGLCKEGYQSL